MSVKEIAESIQRWALSTGMMGGRPATADFDRELIRSVFGGVGVPLATGILQDRKISYVGINEPKNEIVIFTTKKMSVREHNLLSRVFFKSTDDKPAHITFMHSGVAHVGGPPPVPPGIPAYHMHHGRFTCGSSVYLGSEKGAGTLGALVRDAAGDIFGLSNNHVTGGSNYAVPGLPIVSPGIVDVSAGGQDPETVGHHDRIYPFLDGNPDVVNASENIDAALFKIRDLDRISSMQRMRYDTPTNVLPMSVGMGVEKVGRTTEFTQGKVIAELVGYTNVIYELDLIGGRKVVYFRNIFAVTSNNPGTVFSAPGDSGSLITFIDQNNNRYGVGIVFAGTQDGLTLAISLDRITQYFSVELVSGLNI